LARRAAPSGATQQRFEGGEASWFDVINAEDVALSASGQLDELLCGPDTSAGLGRRCVSYECI
jgi:hypothetical protein